MQSYSDIFLPNGVFNAVRFTDPVPDNRVMNETNQRSNSLSAFLGGMGSNQNPYTPIVGNYQSRISSLIDNPDSVKDSAAYKFRLNQGLDGVNRSMGARGLLGSGNRLAALNDYAQGQASQEYGDQFNRLATMLGQNIQGEHGQDATRLGWGNIYSRMMPPINRIA